MYTLINHNVDALLDAIDPQNDIQRYIWLLETLRSEDITNHAAFQQSYRRYWQLNPARLSAGYLASYFTHLEHLKHQPVNQAEVEAVTRYFLPIPTQGNGRQSLQFSFASKLVHMLRPEQPVYDSMVQSFFFLPSGGENEKTEQKLARLLASYNFLCHEYERVLQHSLLAPAIARFREHFQVNEDYTDVKVIDTLIWKFVALLKSGAIRDGDVVYG